MLLVVIPAFNEAKTIGRVLSGLFEHGYTNVVVVDDGSTDATSEVARAAGAVVLRHRINRGQGAALQTGDEYALQSGANIVVHFDADGQFNPADIAGALKLLEQKNVAVVLGSRFIDGRSKLPWTKEHVLFPITRTLNRFFTGLTLTDGQNGFRVLSRTALEKLTITHDGMAHNSEIIKQIKELALTYVEYPVEVVYHRYGQGLGGGLKIVGTMLLRFFYQK
jgi:glycosyltransferase involved in cell wall biosynthesis